MPLLTLTSLPSNTCKSCKLTLCHHSAITPANNVAVNQKCLNLVTEEHALDRTIGVVTKADRIEEGDHEIVRIEYAFDSFTLMCMV
jgi:hypothetical protein